MNYGDIRNFEERAYGPEGHGNSDAKDAVTKMEFIIHLLLDEIEELRDYIEAQIKKYPVYTSPPQRKPLTDEDIVKLIVRTWGSASIAPQSVPEFARAIELAHGIKGKK